MEFDQLVQKYKEFNAYLSSITPEFLKENCTRQELTELYEELKTVKSVPFTWELSRLIKAMKEEEFPELKGIHHYPELNEIDFMSEEKKLNLDKHLMMLRPGHYVFGLYRITNQVEQLEAFLLSKGIIKEVYHLVCPVHYNQKVSPQFTLKMVESIKKSILNQETSLLEDEDESLYCPECDEFTEYSRWDNRYLQKNYILSKSISTKFEDV